MTPGANNAGSGAGACNAYGLAAAGAGAVDAGATGASGAWQAASSKAAGKIAVRMS
jgi:hypothetical protein